ncbi:MAG: hypothetical protein IPI90_14365 [Saprospiraceae bacterium]|nr:hypothetical protein [Candidatus Vicinibacter affinis]
MGATLRTSASPHYSATIDRLSIVSHGSGISLLCFWVCLTAIWKNRALDCSSTSNRPTPHTNQSLCLSAVDLVY